MSDADNGHIWWIAITELIVVTLISFVATDCIVFFMSKTADRHIVANGLRVLVLMPYRFGRRIYDLELSR